MSEAVETMHVSLVTTVLNDRSGCERFFESIAAQTLQPDEIVVVDGGSTDGTWEFLETRTTRAQLKTLQRPRCNVARGRNLAIQASSHDLIASTDIGCTWDPEWFEELVTPLLADQSCQAVMGSWKVRKKDLQSDWAKIEFAILNEPKMVATPKAHASSRAIAFRKDLWRRIGGYPEDLTLAADDMVFVLQLQKVTDKIAAAPVPRCFWERPSALRSFGKEARRNFAGAGEAGIWLKHGVLTTGRLIVETALPIAGLALASKSGTRRIGAVMFVVGALSAGLRKARLLPAIGRARRAGVPQPAVRTISFEYYVKFWGAVGYWEGFFRGFRQTRECRRRLGFPRL